MLTIKIYYKGENGSAKAFVKEMIDKKIVDRIRNEKGNRKYEYFFPVEDSETVLLIDCWENEEALDLHHKSLMMEEIAELRKKYKLKMEVTKYQEINNNQDFETVIRKRTAVRKFSDKPLEEEKLNKILEAGRLAPTAKNLQPQKIYVARGKEALNKIDKASPCRYNAPVVLVICSDKEKAYHKDEYSTYEIDAVVVTTHMMLEATNIGVDNIWIEKFDSKILKEELALPETLEIVCLLPLGYKTSNCKVNPFHTERKDIKKLVEFI